MGIHLLRVLSMGRREGDHRQFSVPKQQWCREERGRGGNRREEKSIERPPFPFRQEGSAPAQRGPLVHKCKSLSRVRQSWAHKEKPRWMDHPRKLSEPSPGCGSCGLCRQLGPTAKPINAPNTCQGCGCPPWTIGRHVQKAQLQDKGGLNPARFTHTHMHAHTDAHAWAHTRGEWRL